MDANEAVEQELAKRVDAYLMREKGARPQPLTVSQAFGVAGQAVACGFFGPGNTETVTLTRDEIAALTKEAPGKMTGATSNGEALERASRAEQAALQVLQDAVAAVGLSAGPDLALLSAAASYGRAHGRRLQAEREVGG